MIQAVLKKKPTDNTVEPSPSETVIMPPQAQTLQSSVTLQSPTQQSSPTGVQNLMATAWPFYQKLKPLEIPVFDGSKAKFEDFWALFSSLVDNSSEPPHVKMARLRQSLKGTALDANRGLGVSQPEFEEAILETKFGGKRRQLHAYMAHLEGMPPFKGGDVQGFEKYADLVRISVVKLRAEGSEGELGEGTLHVVLVKKLGERQVESYSGWLRENEKERSVINFNEWLKEEVKIRVEAKEMVHGVESVDGKRDNTVGGKPRFGEKGKVNSFFTGAGGGSKEERPPCALCEGNHGIWSCRKFQGMDVRERWSVAKARRLCFRCLGSYHQGRACSRSKKCNINGCTKIHHTLLHDTHLHDTQPAKKEPEQEESSQQQSDNGNSDKRYK